MRTLSLNRMLSIVPGGKLDPPGSPMKRGPKSIFGAMESQDSSLGRGIRCAALLHLPMLSPQGCSLFWVG